MEENIKFDDYGCEIIERNNKLFLRFDEGHFNIQLSEYEISEEEAKKVMISSEDAYQVILKVQARNKNEEKPKKKGFLDKLGF
ncbi:MAG: hypothetical protein WBG71_15920 [Leeuwenhoekiella sp.]